MIGRITLGKFFSVDCRKCIFARGDINCGLPGGPILLMLHYTFKFPKKRRFQSAKVFNQSVDTKASSTNHSLGSNLFDMGNEKQETILFVDDEESILNVSSEYFRRKGYQTLTAKNGIEALRILEEEKIDCCFTDINMPEMNGLDLAEKIRINDNTMPVIVMTGYPSL
jgi:PleD family two-component response regulator